MIARAIFSFQLRAFGLPLSRIGGCDNRTMADMRRCSTKSARAVALVFIAFVSGISLPIEGFAYSGLTGKVSSLLCQTRVAAAGSQEDYARTLYAEADPVVQQRCLGCHIENGIAPNAGAKLALKRQTAANHAAFNHNAFQSLAALRSPQHILSKAQGASHGGGAVLGAFDEDYQALKDYVNALDASFACNAADGLKGQASFEEAVWKDVARLSPAETYRRAAIVVGRTVPSRDELEAVESGQTSLDEALAGLMSGPGFHDFLVTGANDQLLTDAFMNGLFPVSIHSSHFPLVGAIDHELFKNVGEEAFRDNRNWELWIAQNYGHARAPTELIAHIVENDLPYKEILTADFTMVTPLTGDLFNSDAEWDEEVVYDGTFSNFHMEFKPGVNRGQLFSPRPGADKKGEACIPVPHGECYMESFTGRRKAHAGVLSTLAFLQRYPTTETNRNRARARWAYKFFLAVDIEASAARTTDPVALADTNNPTMYNPACTVCHEAMDPVAGAFQNYDELGNYRADFEDSLPWIYKTEEGTPYKEGDTWFRDMRKPGFKGVVAPNDETSLVWLGKQMANDPRFAIGTVEFWWPAVIGSAVLSAPEDPSLPGYGDQLMAFNLQRHEMGRLALEFSQSGFKLKSLLQSMMLSHWFNVSALNEDHPYKDVLLAARLSVNRLLTPEELEAKTRALLGITVGYGISDWILPLEYSYLSESRVALGGIDSYQVKDRARDMTSVAAVVTGDHALKAAETIAETDREIRDGARALLNGVDFTKAPVDSPSLRDLMVDLYLKLHAKSYEPDHQAIDLLVDLLVEAYALPDYDSGRYIGHQTGQEAERLLREASERGELKEDDRYRSPEEYQNTKAWRLVLDYMLSHFDYVHD